MRPRTPRDRAESSTPAPQSPSTDLKRRRFLLTLGAGGASVAAASAATLPNAVAADAPAAADNAAGGYRETEHVRDYYRTARI